MWLLERLEMIFAKRSLPFIREIKLEAWK